MEQQAPDTTNHEPQTAAETIREAVVSETSRKEWLYVGLVDTDFKCWEDEEEYIRAGGAIDALLELARGQGFEDELRGAEEEGRKRLREHVQECRENGPSRLEEIKREISCIESEVPLREYGPDSAEREKRGYYGLRNEKLAIEGDLEIADLTLRYLDGEDIQG